MSDFFSADSALIFINLYIVLECGVLFSGESFFFLVIPSSGRECSAKSCFSYAVHV